MGEQDQDRVHPRDWRNFLGSNRDGVGDSRVDWTYREGPGGAGYTESGARNDICKQPLGLPQMRVVIVD